MPNDQVTNRSENTPVTSDLDTFLQEITQLASGGSSTRGRLIFGLDATASREWAWDTACKLQAEMFREAASTGGLDLQLVYYRGIDECKASKWVSDPVRLGKIMSTIMCRSGETQIRRILEHAVKETKLLPVSALVFVGDAFEEEADAIIPAAHELGRLGVRVFMFQEGEDREVEHVFRQIADVTTGAYCRFDQGSARQLAELLRAVAAFVTGGLTALANRHDAGAIKLLGQLR
ncbi:MAG TPA: VWA domain-containing protein [Pseudolabrys sp.]|nr:VWA domain-containing protein [Pseudolabrys sp.]